jgi:hypothetical protein
MGITQTGGFDHLLVATVHGLDQLCNLLRRSPALFDFGRGIGCPAEVLVDLAGTCVADIGSGPGREVGHERSPI